MVIQIFFEVAGLWHEPMFWPAVPRVGDIVTLHENGWLGYEDGCEMSRKVERVSWHRRDPYDKPVAEVCWAVVRLSLTAEEE